MGQDERGARMSAWQPESKVLVGIIGGIGPSASVLLYQYITELRKCDRDDGHIPVLIYNNPQIPNNNQALNGEGPPSLPALIYTAKMLQKAGATHVTMACNTAHAFYNELQKAIAIPVIDMVRLTAKYIAKQERANNMVGEGITIGLLGTTGTIRSQLYHKAIRTASGKHCAVSILTPNPPGQDIVQTCINRIKAGEHNSPIVEQAVFEEAQTLSKRGASIIITACTELPLVLSNESKSFLQAEVLDPMLILAQEIIAMTEASFRSTV